MFHHEARWKCLWWILPFSSRLTHERRPRAPKRYGPLSPRTGLDGGVNPVVVDGPGLKGVDPGMEEFVRESDPVVGGLEFSEFAILSRLGVGGVGIGCL
jgi:hypothetical protein